METIDYNKHIQMVLKCLVDLKTNYTDKIVEEELDKYIQYIEKMQSTEYKYIANEEKTDFNNQHPVARIKFNSNLERDRYIKQVLTVSKIEDTLKPIVAEIWRDTTTKVDLYSKKGEFNFLVNAVNPMASEKELESFVKNMQGATSLSLISDKHLATYDERNIGFIYQLKEGKIITAAVDNLASDYLSPVNKQSYQKGEYTEQQLLDEGIDSYMTVACSKIMTPTLLTQLSQEKQDEPFNYYFSHNEIETYTNELQLVGIFCKTLGDKGHSKDWENAVSLGKKINLPIIEIDQTICREEHGCNAFIQNEEQQEIDILRRANTPNKLLNKKMKQIEKRNIPETQKDETSKQLVNSLRKLNVNDIEYTDETLSNCFKDVTGIDTRSIFTKIKNLLPKKKIVLRLEESQPIDRTQNSEIKRSWDLDLEEKRKIQQKAYEIGHIHSQSNERIQDENQKKVKGMEH